MGDPTPGMEVCVVLTLEGLSVGDLYPCLPMAPGDGTMDRGSRLACMILSGWAW